MGWTVGRAEKRVQSKANDRASVVQVYTAGLRFETEPMVCTGSAASALGQIDALGSLSQRPNRQRLPLQCPLVEGDWDQHSDVGADSEAMAAIGSTWTALWQVACLLRPEVSPVLWRQRIRRLARIVKGQSASGAGLEAPPGLDNTGLKDAAPIGLTGTVVAQGMSQWIQRLMPAGMLGVTDRYPGVSVTEGPALELKTLEDCVRSGGVALLGWQRVRPERSGLRDQAQVTAVTSRHWQWRVVAGIEGLKPLGLHFQSRSVLLLPQEGEAVWGCGYGKRLDPNWLAGGGSRQLAGLWALRGLDGALSTVDVVRVLGVEPLPG